MQFEVTIISVLKTHVKKSGHALTKSEYQQRVGNYKNQMEMLVMKNMVPEMKNAFNGFTNQETRQN